MVERPGAGAKSSPPESEDGASEISGGEVEERGEPAQETSESKGPLNLERELEDARRESVEHRDRSLRLAAELENMRKRMSRELETARQHALERFASDLLPVIDSLELARGTADDAPESLREGLEMTLRLLVDILKRHHISVVDPLGQSFDPNLHEAMATQPASDVSPNTIVQVVQKGYRLHDRLLRPARVIVSRAPDA